MTSMRVGRIPYINCYPVYGAIDRGIVPLDGTLVDGVPTALNALMANGLLDVSVISAIEYARASHRYLLLPNLAISCDGPVRSVLLFSRVPADELGGRQVIVSTSSMTSVALLQLLFDNVWCCRPEFVPGNAELSDVRAASQGEGDARLVIGDAALYLGQAQSAPRLGGIAPHPYVYDLGAEWKQWTGLPFVFAVWVASRSAPAVKALGVHASLIASRDWGLENIQLIAEHASEVTSFPIPICEQYLTGLDYALSYEHLAGLTDFFRRLVGAGRVPNGTLAFLSAA
ncbi:MAG: menaquinone biosynthetic enzyme MqnA/MqnD family protein [Gemmatimonadaceae bacterium]